MSTIPEVCLAYTEVFATMKLEFVIAIAVGVLIGYWMQK